LKEKYGALRIHYFRSGRTLRYRRGKQRRRFFAVYYNNIRPLGDSRIDSGGGVVEFILLFTHARQIDITTLRIESREELEVRDGSLFDVMSYEKSGVCSFLYVSFLV